MLGEQVGKRLGNGIDLRRLGARLTLAAVLSGGLMIGGTNPRALAQTTQTSNRSDAEIQTDVAYALTNSKSLKGQHITAATVEGDVTISGNVSDEASKELAESLLYRVNGVRTVTDNLTVGNAAPAPSQGQVAGGDTAVPSVDPNAAPQDPNYDPAQQNMAPVGPQDQAQNQQDPSAPMQGAPMQSGSPDPQQQSSADQSSYPRQPYGQQPLYGQQRSYSAQPAGPVTIPTGTLLQVRTSEPLDATRVKPGQAFQATVAADVYQGPILALPRGAVITGTVVATTNNKGELAGKQGLSLVLSSVNLNGQVYTLPTDTWSSEGPGKGGYSAANTIGTAGLGAVIGAIAGGGAGAAIGAGAGAIVGAGASAATTGPRMYVPAEAVLNFHLLAPITVTPVSPQEAQRLASNGYPQMQRRGPYPYGYRGYPPPPPPPGYYYYPYRAPVAYSPYYYYGYRY